MAPAVSERRVGELVGDDIVSERERAVLERAVKHDEPAPIPSRRRLEQNARGPATALSNFDPKGRVVHELCLDRFRQLREDSENPRPQFLIPYKRGDEL